MSGPLGMVTAVSMIKDAYEDYQRYKSDKEENNKKTLVYCPEKKKFEKSIWQSIRPGMLIKVEEDEQFPADIVVLQSNDKSGGGLFVETKNLDGETNLKTKSVSKSLNDIYNSYGEENWK